MSVIFDEAGKPVNSIPDENRDAREGTVVICPNCQSVTVYPIGMLSEKKKIRICGRCQTILGEW